MAGKPLTGNVVTGYFGAPVRSTDTLQPIMIKKKFYSAAFTLIELLVVITIIGILAGIALPVFNSVQVRGSQTKALAQAKQIGLALKLFAGDNDGVYPKTGTPTQLASCTTSNDAFAALFPTYTTSESIFANKLSAWNTSTPDNVIDNPYTGSRSQTLKTGENAYSYMEGLTDASNPISPIVFDAPADTSGTYKTQQNSKGGVWSGTKAVVIHLDNSGGLDNLTVTGSGANGTATDQGYDPNAQSATKVNILSTSSNTSLTGDSLLLPQ